MACVPCFFNCILSDILLNLILEVLVFPEKESVCPSPIGMPSSTNFYVLLIFKTRHDFSPLL